MELKAHLSVPEAPHGCLVIVHENRGLDDHIRDVANRFASEGFAVAAPDYLSPIGGSVSDVDTNIAGIKIFPVTRSLRSVDIGSVACH